MSTLTKEELASFLLDMGAYEVRIADPHQGFEHALPQRHPLALFPDCRSVVVFIVPRPGWANNTAIAVKDNGNVEEHPDHLPLADRLFHAPGWTAVSVTELLRQRIWLAGSNLLLAHGHQVGQGYVQEKLCAHEAGIGVYGRSGLILHPVLGNRISPGVLQTDAEFEPDPKLNGYEPCSGCSACMKACPAAAFDLEQAYPESWSREACQSKRNQLAADGIYCHECFRACPAGTAEDNELMVVRRLRNFEPNRRAGDEMGTPPRQMPCTGQALSTRTKILFS
jgi:epoxyqueuosine reductase QueG